MIAEAEQLEPGAENPPMAAQGCAEGCVYRVSMRGGAPISVRICMLCHRIDFDDLSRQARELVQRATMPEHLRGDGPCKDCGNEDNIHWEIDNALWNQVMGGPAATDDPGGILCIPCFVKRTDTAGYRPNGWRLLPMWHWETVQERADRRARELVAVPSETANSSLKPPRYPHGGAAEFEVVPSETPEATHDH